MEYLEKLQKVKINDTVYVKSRDSQPIKSKIVEINGDEATLNCNGNDNKPWRFSISTSNAINPPTAYWISCYKGNNP